MGPPAEVFLDAKTHELIRANHDYSAHRELPDVLYGFDTLQLTPAIGLEDALESLAREWGADGTVLASRWTCLSALRNSSPSDWRTMIGSYGESCKRANWYLKPLTAEWIDKAEADYRSMRWELQAPANPNYDAVCFHAQQCIEKYLKARLEEAGVVFPRTNDLEEPLKLAVALEPAWANLQPRWPR